MAGRFVIAGPPCAGKSTYAREHMERGDVIYDYDTVHQALSGMASHEHDSRIRPYVLATRDTVLAALAKDEKRGAWVITSSPKAAEIERLKSLLGAEVVLVTVQQSEAHRRCDADGRPAEWHGYIDNWFGENDFEGRYGAPKAGRATMKHKQFNVAQFKALDEAQGQFEAIVAVFGNVDRGGDRIMPGAFAESLKRWEASGDPIPILFAHEWDNLDAHIGYTLEAREVDEGLYVKGQLDMEEAFAARVWKKMQRRTLKQFSFAYDVLDSKQVSDKERVSPNHYQDLLELDLMEVGPCLVGMNPDTELLGVKAGARHTAKEFDAIQRIHDDAHFLGAKCMPVEDDGGAEDDEATRGENESEDEAGGKGADGKSSGFDPSAERAMVVVRLADW